MTVATTAVGCNANGHGATVVECVFDVSLSANSAATKAQYLRDFGAVVNSLGPGDRCTISPITGNSQATAGTLFGATMPSYNPLTDNVDTYRAKSDAVRRQLKRQAAALLNSPAGSTDLLHAFGPCGERFSGRDGTAYADKRLVIFSDMISQSAGEDFSADRLSAQRDGEIVGALRRDGEMPDLRNVNVYVAGAYSGEQWVAPRKMADIKAFWLRYFADAGAHIDPNDYGASLTNYPRGG